MTQTGFYICLWFYLDSVLFHRRIQVSLNLKQFPELPNSQFINKIRKVIAGFSTPPPHHVQHLPPTELPASLRIVKFVFVREDASKPSLAPLYRGTYLVVERRSKFFRLQIGDKVDAVSVDRLKPVFSDSPVIPAKPLLWGRPPHQAAQKPNKPSSAVTSSAAKKKSVTFLTKPEIILRRNPHRQARVRRSCSALTPPFLLGGEYCGGRRSRLEPDMKMRQDEQLFCHVTSI